jgi:uncharacterized protein YqjF (DUF2071 family)
VWSDLCLVTYAVAPSVLEHRLPPGFQLDALDGACFVSLVAFDFLQTRVKGLAFPGHVDFPEINLRFYVVAPDGRRGVMFIRELVPRPLIAWVARAIYNEPYAATRMRSQVKRGEDRIEITHDWTWHEAEHRLHVVSKTPSAMPPTDSVEHFFKEHQWGFGLTRGGETLSYEVKHPHWEVHEVLGYEIQSDLGQLYGPEFAGLETQDPFSVVHAVGSAVEVHPAQ